MPDPDFLIVGSGLSALSVGALLARSGRSVRIVEAHTEAGGYGHTFSLGATAEYRFNAQLHYVWNCGPGRTVHKFLRKLDLHETVTFERYDVDGFDRTVLIAVGANGSAIWRLVALRRALRA